MNIYRADFHIHTVLSPCGDVEMSPKNIVEKASEKGLDIIGITDHNSTLHCKTIKELAEKKGIFVLMGAEVTTQEEAHCLAFFENTENLSQFQTYLDKNLPKIINDSDKFGYQLVVDEDENVLDEIEYLLISGINQNINNIEKKVHELNGIFIPAHIDKKRYSIISQLGFIPDDLKMDAVEISQNCSKNSEIYKMLIKRHISIITNSDAHCIDQVGNTFNLVQLEHRTFSEIKKALDKEEGRKIIYK